MAAGWGAVGSWGRVGCGCGRNVVVALTFGLCVFLFACRNVEGNSVNTIDAEEPARRHHQRHHGESDREEKGYCAPYNGKICKQFISGPVWYSLEDPTGGWRNEQVTTALWDELIVDLTGLCREAAEVN